MNATVLKILEEMKKTYTADRLNFLGFIWDKSESKENSKTIVSDLQLILTTFLIDLFQKKRSLKIRNPTTESLILLSFGSVGCFILI